MCVCVMGSAITECEGSQSINQSISQSPVVGMVVQGVFAQIDSREEVVVVGEEQGFARQPQGEENKHLWGRGKSGWDKMGRVNHKTMCKK